VDAVDRVLCSVYGDDRQRSLIVVGQSMGGVVGARLHTRGWHLDTLVTIGSPLHGAAVLNYAVDCLPSTVVDWAMKPNYEYLMLEKRMATPPHAGHCITMSWPFIGTFDGCVFVDEARFDEWPHTHLTWADHRTVFANPRLWHAVYVAIDTTHSTCTINSL